MAYKTPEEIVRTVVSIGRSKSTLSWGKLIILSFLAGAYIALGGLLAEIIGGGVPAVKASCPGLAKLIFAAVFPVGLMFVVIAGSELFTGNTALMIPSTLLKVTRWRALGWNWLWSFVGNFVGSVFVALCLAYGTGLLSSEPWLSYARGIAENKVQQDFVPLLLKGVGCNWLVCLAVWLAIASEDIAGKILGIWWPIMGFVALGYEHSVANMFFVPAGIFLGAQVTWEQFLLRNLLPVTVGNIIGGMMFVGVFYTYLYGRREA